VSGHKFGQNRLLLVHSMHASLQNVRAHNNTQQRPDTTMVAETWRMYLRAQPLGGLTL
jgi:hypothetical protein